MLFLYYNKHLKLYNCVFKSLNLFKIVLKNLKNLEFIGLIIN